MPPYGTDLAIDSGEVTEQHRARHYRLRAREIGLVIVKHNYVDLGGRFTAIQIGIHQDNLQSGLEHLVAS
jgi:2,4-dienoyl-CoA reductase-like NADH-dependent reductase (Old Yellow Enzyme family)